MIIKTAQLLDGFCVRVDDLEIEINCKYKEIIFLNFRYGDRFHEKIKDRECLRKVINYLFLYKLLNAYKV